MGEVEGMTVNDRKRIDDFIKEYLLIDIKIKISKAKMIHAEYNNNVLAVSKQQKIQQKLQELKTNIESNINNKYLEYLKVFKMDTDEAIQEFNINKNNLFKLKKEIRAEFYDMVIKGDKC